ncbi:MAG TPA: hypothetical protein VFQ78_03775 [Candidatus Udaeobacter sp.]|jgi:hypothetical protein|nr:hypothetical protein [Candidatus Udaeobacter sp.]
MNDFSDLENELRKLRPASPSPVLFERVDAALEDCPAGATPAINPRKISSLPWNWWSLGFGLAAAAALIVFLIIGFQSMQERPKRVAESSAPQSETTPVSRRLEKSTSLGEFVSAGGAHVVYNARDEGLQFAHGSERPLRRVRYQTQQTWRWRNPETGASLRVSYPSEEIMLIPVSGQ